MRHFLVFLFSMACGLFSTVSGKELAKPTPQQVAWQNNEIGMFIHFGLETWLNKESDDEPDLENLKLFDPPNVDVAQWVDVAESFGAKYIVLVAKHVGGFCLGVHLDRVGEHGFGDPGFVF